MRLFFIVSILIVCLEAKAQLPPIGEWREHLQFSKAIAVTNDNEFVYCATPLSVFSVSQTENYISRFSKVTGLNDIGVSTIRFDNSSGQLVIAYSNSNIDIVYRNDVYNIPDIKRKNINGDKSIYNIAFKNKRAYLCTGFGIVVMDLEKFETKDTYIIGNGGSNVKVNGFASDNSLFYTATNEGLKSALQSSSNLSNFNVWQFESGSNNLSAGLCENVLNVSGRIVVQKNDSLFVKNGNTWTYFFTDGWDFTNVNESNGKILISEQKGNFSQRRVIVLNSNGVVEKTIENNAQLSQPLQAIATGNDVWIADNIKTLIKNFGTSFAQFEPNSPYGPLDGESIVYNNVLWVAGGSVNDAWNYLYNFTGFFQFKDDEWDYYNGRKYPWMDTVYDILAMAIDPRDETIYAGSYGRGLIEWKTNNQIKVYKQNSAINPTIGDPLAYRISGLKFDNENNLWISNWGGANNFHVKKADGNWKSFNVPFSVSEKAVAQIEIDDVDQKWIVSPKGNGLFCFNHGNSIDITTDDNWRWYRTGRGFGNLPSNFVNCIAKDKDGFIWVGTDNGIGLLQCTQDVFSSQGCEAILPIVQQDQFAGFLFQNEVVQTIAVDGANRKWVGTRNGLWLISADGAKIIYRFSEDNSPLLSNDVKKIAINQQTGEIFISTFRGICSFRSTATEGTETNENVLVFPNPVPPNYSGTIAVRGVANNAIVKITEMDGRLVYQTRALGGQAVWNGRNYKGERVSTGVYLVLVAGEGNVEKVVTKIVFVK